MADLTSSMLAFSALLRTKYDIPAGHARAYEALRSLEVVGIRDPARARYALRLVFCSKAGELDRFDEAFDEFFASEQRGVRRLRQKSETGEDGAEPKPSPVERREPQSEPDPADAWLAMHARYSPAAAEERAPPSVSDAGLAETLADASRLIAGLRLGRSRRWKPQVRARRFDLRHTLRASLQTGGDPVRIRALGHPLRNPRIVVLLDASRSMSEYTQTLLQFAYALVQRSRRTRVFIFSTALRDVTQDLRAMLRTGERHLQSLGAAWGGGTRIGACMLEFVRKHASHLDADTLTIVASDGLDAGDVSDVGRAMRQIYRRCAGVVWLNPHAGEPGFEPAAAGMKAALPYVSALLDVKDVKSIGAAARHLRR